MRLAILTAVCGSIDITKQWFEETIARTITKPMVVIVSNGNTREEIDELVALKNGSGLPGVVWDTDLLTGGGPLGSTRAYNHGLNWLHHEMDRPEVVATIHNDLMVREEGWDAEVLGFFQRHPDAGVVGFHGSRALCDMNIWNLPYQKILMARGDSCSNMEDAEAHGARVTHPTEVVTCDGMSLIARRSDFELWGGFDERYIHHMYDHDLCVTARAHGRRNYMLPISVRHISGQTANMPRYNERFAELGGDAGVHDQAHYAFYQKWQRTGQLPARVRN